jgi:hypothetical protein
MMIPLSAGLHAHCKWGAATGSKVQWDGKIERRFAPDFCTKNPQGNQRGASDREAHPKCTNRVLLPSHTVQHLHRPLCSEIGIDKQYGGSILHAE